MSSATATKRPYMNRKARRAQLLECAAAIVDREGWSGLTMVSLAKEANASRQLIYQHFTSIEELMRDTSDHLFADLVATIDAVFETPGLSAGDAVEKAARTTFALPEGRVAALLQLLARPYSPDDEISRVCRRARRASTKIAEKLLARGMPELPDAERVALAGMFDMAIWSAHLTVRDGRSDRESAIKTYRWTVEKLISK